MGFVFNAQISLAQTQAMLRDIMTQRAVKLKTPCGWTAEGVEAFFQTLSQNNPAPETELLYSNPYQLLVAVVLSAQATDVGVNRATAPLFKTVKSPAQMLALGLPALINHIKTIGLFNAKAKNVIALSALLLRDHDGLVPDSRAALEALPGVGRKTANVVLNVIFGHETCAVDTHVFRVANRTGLAPGKTPDAVEAALMTVIPPAYRRHAHHWLILHGRYLCVARRPKCPICPVSSLCRYKNKEII
jgi:endonuclease III